MLENMNNKYPKPCGICQGWVLAEEGILRGSKAAGWVVTHADACPKSTIRHGHAQAYARRVVSVLRRKNSTADEIEDALTSFNDLVRTGWVKRGACERIILSSPAFAHMDRVEIEMFLDRRLVHQESHC